MSLTPTLTTCLVTLALVLPLRAQGADDPISRGVQPEVLASGGSAVEVPGHVVPMTALPYGLSGGRITPIHTAESEPSAGPYGVWAAGAHYKVSFHGDMTFIPYVDGDYPHNQPLSWHTESVKVGDYFLMKDGEIPRRQHDDLRYEYRFRSFTEAYDVRMEGVEQSFIVNDRPTVQGDLVIRGRLSTRLRAEPFSATHRGILFVDQDGRHLVNYGEAFIIDANGNKAEIDTSYEEGIITLVVPQSWIETAVFPITVDPLVAPSVLHLGTGSPPLTVDICRDDRSNAVLVTFTRQVSATDADAWGYVFTDGFTNALSGAQVFTDIATWNTVETRCANVGPPAANKFVIGIIREVPSRSVRVWVHPSNNLTLQTLVRLGPFSVNRQDQNIDVGGIEAFDQSGFDAAGTDALVVFQRDSSGTVGANTNSSEIWGIVVDCSTASGSLGTAFRISASDPQRDSEFPSVTKVSEGEEGGNPTSWIVAYQTYDSRVINNAWDIRGRRVDANAGVSTTFWFPIDGGARDAHRINPQIEGQRGRYLVGYGKVNETPPLTKITGQLSNEVNVERFDWPVGGVISKLDETRPSGIVQARTFIVGDAAYDTDTDSHWAVLWRAPPRTGRLFISRHGYTGIELENPTVSTPGPSAALVDGGLCYDDDGNRFALAWGLDNNSIGTNPVVANYLVFPTETSAMVSGTACSSAAIGWRGQDQQGNSILENDQQIGNQFAGVRLTGMPSNAISLVVIGLASTSVPVVHPAVGRGCNNNVAILAQTTIQIGGTAFFNLPLPELLGPGTLYFQGWHTNAGGNLFLSTGRLAVPVIK